jgi:hypothetical protein
MRPIPARCAACLFAALLLLTPSSFAFDTPLSDQAVREAYFLGQRHDDSMSRLLARYAKFLPPPESGPHIYSIEFLTPFALLVKESSQLSSSSAQQVEKQHKGDDEIVAVSIEIYLTPSYGALITRPTGSRSGSPVGYQFRNPDFWKSFDLHVYNGNEEVKDIHPRGEPTYMCVNNGGCELTGAIVRFELPAKIFASDSAAVEVDPHVSDPVGVEFDLASLR